MVFGSQWSRALAAGWHRSLCVGGRQPRRGPVDVGVDHARGEHPVHPSGGGDLPREPSPELRISGQLGTYDLHGDRAATGGAAQIHLAHASGPQPGHDPVPADPTRISRRQLAERGHPDAPLPASRPAEPAGSYPSVAGMAVVADF
jgi:hypothetical protein